MISKTVKSHILRIVRIYVALLAFIGCWFGGLNGQATFSMPKGRVLQTKRAQYRPTKRTMSDVKLYPADEASKDLSFVDFKWRLRRAVRKRDSRFILTTIDPEIRLGLGGERGLEAFKKEWHPEKRSSGFWRQLRIILSLGGTFESVSGERKYCAPYVTTRWKTLVKRFPEFGNASGYAVVLRRNVKVRARPSTSAPVVGILSFEVVKVGQGNVARRTDRVGLQWAKIRTLRGRSGYVDASDVRSPIDYSACFKKVNGRWMMVTFIAGD